MKGKNSADVRRRSPPWSRSTIKSTKDPGRPRVCTPEFSKLFPGFIHIFRQDPSGKSKHSNSNELLYLTEPLTYFSSCSLIHTYGSTSPFVKGHLHKHHGERRMAAGKHSNSKELFCLSDELVCLTESLTCFRFG